MGIPGATRTLATLLRIPAFSRSRFGLGRVVFDKRLLTSDRVRRYADTIAGDRKRRTRLKRFFQSFDAADVGIVNQLISQLRTPTMVVWGADDSCSSSSWSKTLYEAIPGARRLELIPFAGASCQEERPDLFAAALTNFLDEIDSEVAASHEFRFHQKSGTMARTSRV
jgi:pimeloyl-ACP methyl ester carboxylesterase